MRKVVLRTLAASVLAATAASPAAAQWRGHHHHHGHWGGGPGIRLASVHLPTAITVADHTRITADLRMLCDRHASLFGYATSGRMAA